MVCSFSALARGLSERLEEKKEAKMDLYTEKDLTCALTKLLETVTTDENSMYSYFITCTLDLFEQKRKVSREQLLDVIYTLP